MSSRRVTNRHLVNHPGRKVRGLREKSREPLVDQAKLYGELRCARANRPTLECFLSSRHWKSREQTRLGVATKRLGTAGAIRQLLRNMAEGSEAERLPSQGPVRGEDPAPWMAF
jgi:hypothetical protein